MTSQLETLSDYPALKKLAEALWRQDSKQCGAAIMVGAGFSRCSASHVGGAKKLPLWFDFANKLARELDENNKDLAKADPLRLAEEYRAFFGQAALNALIKSEIEDDAWTPGVLHSRLLSLPWSEVMTTNWDTLLERAAVNVHSPVYSVVAKQSDLSYARSPRIVKLHGSIGVTEKLIFAQEDYRRYPQEFAAFVNFARQTFIENELCLIGFSGDDPNFLQWAGWVRDNLADHSRRIYLVGALKLTAAKRKLLESINIAPIDLWEAVKDYDDHDAKHVRATGLFLDALLSSKPKEMHKWAPSSLAQQQLSGQDLVRQLNDSERAALILEGQIDTLRLDRETYPGWLACPSSLLWQVRSQPSDPYPNPRNIACMKPEARSKLLYEIAWRHSVTFEPIGEWLTIELSKIADPNIACAISKRQQLELALLLLKRARFNNDQQEFDKWLAVLGSHILFMPDGAAELAYQQALRARDQLDFPALERAAEAVQGEDPIWKLRKASLLAEIGNFEASKQEVSEAYGELRRRSRHDPNSIWIQSRLAWAHWFFRAVNYFSEGAEIVETLSEKFRSTRCDPWEYITYIRERISKQQADFFKSQQKIEPLFEQGSYRDLSKSVSFSNEVPAVFLLDGLTEVVGLPFRWENVNLLSGDVEQLVTADAQAGSTFFHLAIRAANSDSSVAIKRVFSRMTLASTAAEVVDDLVSRIISAIAYWRERARSSPHERKHHAIEEIRVYVEVLARLSMRLSADRAISVFRLAMEIGQDKALHDWWLFEVLEHLISYSLNSIPSARHSELLLEALGFPLPNEIAGQQMADRWPNPIIDTACDRGNGAAFDRAVSRLIDSARVGSSSTPALLRLLPLIRNNVLKPDELDKLATVLWGTNPDYKALPAVELYSHALLTLPAPDRQRANSAIASHMFEAEVGLFFTNAHLAGLIGASQLKSTPLLPDGKQALFLFDRLVAWRPSPPVADPLGFGSQREDLIGQVGQVLCFCVLPVLPSTEITEQRFGLLMALYTDANASSVVMALPYFTSVSDRITNLVASVIRKGMRGHSSKEVSWSVHALYQWKSLAAADKVPNPPENLFMQLGNLIESKRHFGLTSLLWTVGELLKKKWLPVAEVKTLVECLPELFQSVDYKNIDPTSEEAVTASLIREQCVCLTLELLKESSDQTLLSLIEGAKVDPLPEVRFAAQVT